MGNREAAEIEILKMSLFKWADQVHSLTSKLSRSSPQFKNTLDQISREAESLVDDMIESLAQGKLDRPAMEIIEQFNQHIVDLSKIK